MKREKNKLFIISSLILFLSCLVIALEVNVQSYPPPNVTYYPPDQKPADLKEFEGDATGNISVGGAYPDGSGYQWACGSDGKGGQQVTVSGTKLTVSGSTDIRLPEGTAPDDDLAEHENGHYELDKFEFENFAKKKVEDAFAGFEGTRPVPAGKDCNDVTEEIQNDYNERLDRAIEAIQEQAQEMHDHYDSNELTAHGDNNNITAAEAVEQVKNKRLGIQTQKEQAGTNVQPDQKSAKQITSGVGAVYDMNNVIMWSPVRVNIQNLTIPTDPINTTAVAKLAEIIRIGLQKSKIVRCADSHLIIHDISDANNIFLEASIDDITISDTEKAGFLQMIHGGLNVWYVHNSIGSQFLSFIQDELVQDNYLSMWFYLPEMVIDEDGNWITGELPVSGELILGTAERTDITVSDDFEDPASFIQWHPEGTANITLMPGNAYSGIHSMMFEFNNLPMTESKAVKMYLMPEDLGSGSSIDFRVNLQTTNYDAIDNMFIEVMDNAGHIGIYHFEQPAMFSGQAVLGINGSQWLKISVDKREFGPEIDFSQIMRLSIGIKSGMEPINGMMLIDDISASKSQELLNPEGDLNLDYDVDLQDFAIFAQNWLISGIWP